MRRDWFRMNKSVMTETIRGEMLLWIQQKEIQSDAKDANHVFEMFLCALEICFHCAFAFLMKSVIKSNY